LITLKGAERRNA